MWGSQHLGLQYSTLAYNTYGISVLSYVAQLENPPEALFQLEAAGLRKAAPGPMNWILPQDCWYLREHFGQARSFQSVRHIAKAAQAGVACWESLGTHNAHWQARAKTLAALLKSTSFLNRRYIWASWYARSHVKVLADNMDASPETPLGS